MDDQNVPYYPNLFFGQKTLSLANCLFLAMEKGLNGVHTEDKWLLFLGSGSNQHWRKHDTRVNIQIFTLIPVSVSLKHRQ